MPSNRLRLIELIKSVSKIYNFVTTQSFVLFELIYESVETGYDHTGSAYSDATPSRKGLLLLHYHLFLSVSGPMRVHDKNNLTEDDKNRYDKKFIHILYIHPSIHSSKSGLSTGFSSKYCFDQIGIHQV